MNIPYGFVDYFGHAWGDSSVDTYNRACEEVSKRERMYKNPERGSECFSDLEFYKDQRHKTFVQLVEINQGVKK